MTMRVVALVTGVLACAAAVTARQAVGPSGLGLIKGQVVDEANGQPVPGALVTLTGSNPARRIVVGAGGKFEFSALPAGSYGLQANRPGYLPSSAGQRSPIGPGQPIAISNGADRADIVVPMWKAGSIAGSVMTTASMPLTGVEVHALQRTLAGGSWQWTDAAVAMSDDHGRYHLSNLTPGDFLVTAKPVQDPETPLLMALLTANAASAADVMAGVASSAGGTPEVDGRVPAATTTYYAASPAAGASASIITLPPGAARVGADLRVRQGHGARISGALTGATGPVGGLTVRLVTPIADGAEPNGPDLEVATAACGDDGRFGFSGIAPGRYSLVLTWTPPATPAGVRAGPPGGPETGPPLPADPALWARMPVTVASANITGVQLALHPGSTVSGHVVFDGSGPAPVGLEAANLRLEPVGASLIPSPAVQPARLMVDANGRITSASVTPGRYLLRAAPVRPWAVESATTGDRDIVDDPIDIRSNIVDLVLTLTDRPLGTISGSAVDAGGQPAADASVIVFPANANQRRDTSASARRLRAIRAQATGAFAFANLPPGDYVAVALDADPPANWQSPQRLEAWEKVATRVTVALGEVQRLNLEVIK
jgi:hypothetical protein